MSDQKLRILFERAPTKDLELLAGMFSAAIGIATAFGNRIMAEHDHRILDAVIQQLGERLSDDQVEQMTLRLKRATELATQATDIIMAPREN